MRLLTKSMSLNTTLLTSKLVASSKLNNMKTFSQAMIDLFMDQSVPELLCKIRLELKQKSPDFDYIELLQSVIDRKEYDPRIETIRPSQSRTCTGY